MTEDIREVVREKYALAITSRQGCCGVGQSNSCGDSPNAATNAITKDLYGLDQLEGLDDLDIISFGCGNPTALAELHAGESVLDLGSGAGLDVLLSAKRIGPYGKAYGLDMTDEMLVAARANQERSGLMNVEFLKGHIEEIPLLDNTVDVIISNCVINLSADKDKVLNEAYRVLKPGGRFAVSDIVLTRALPKKLQADLLAWAGCVAGALLEEGYRGKLARAGFVDIDIEITRTYDLNVPEAKKLFPSLTEDEINAANGSIVSAFIRGKKAPFSLTEGVHYEVRQAHESDIPAIKLLLEQNGLGTNGVELGLRDFLVAEIIAKEDTLADAEQGSVIGTVGLEQDGTDVMLRSLAVAPSYRKSLIGKRLVEKALDTAKRNGATTVYALTVTAERYLTKFGFVRIERQNIPESLVARSGVAVGCPSSSDALKLSLNWLA